MRPRHAATVFGCAAVLLGYPDEAAFADDLAAVEAALRQLPAGEPRSGLGRCLAWLGDIGPRAAAAAYVEAFDLRRKTSLYLTYYRYGDTRERGLALAALAGAYRAAGFSLATGELPDFLPALLELAASHPSGQALLAEHRPALSALQEELGRAGSPYAGAVGAVAATLGPLGQEGRAALARYRQLGPPQERVGLEPFAPPEVLGTGAR